MALGKQANPNMDVRLAKHILARTSTIVNASDSSQTSDGGWRTNAAGIHFNQNYGFGLINADHSQYISINKKEGDGCPGEKNYANSKTDALGRKDKTQRTRHEYYKQNVGSDMIHQDSSKHDKQPTGSYIAETEEEQADLVSVAEFMQTGAAYQEIQGKNPQTLAYGLTDSPAGLAGWSA